MSECFDKLTILIIQYSILYAKNAKKLRSVVLKNGKPSDRFKFKIAGEAIPNVKDQPIKCLVYRCLRDTNNVKTIGEQLDQWLGSINKKNFQGKFKVWCN